jgi:hypothetical protein
MRLAGIILTLDCYLVVESIFKMKLVLSIVYIIGLVKGGESFVKFQE